jgi:hypothetical protein
VAIDVSSVLGRSCVVRGPDDQVPGLSCNGLRLLTKRGEAMAVDARDAVEVDDTRYFVIVARQSLAPGGGSTTVRQAPPGCGLSPGHCTARRCARSST